jgi:hypothetical protein
VAAIIPGGQRAYKCADCDKLFCLDGKESLFADVLTTSWQYVHVVYALERGLFTGKGEDKYGRTKFDPNAPITREQFVQVLYSAEGKPDVTAENTFTDVKDAWYKKAVLWAKDNGITAGVGDGTKFGVGNSITRQALALMLYKYAQINGYELESNAGEIDKYGDGNAVASYAKNAMDWAVTNGIISGSGTGSDLSTWKLNPNGQATRAQCAAMLRSFMNKYNP